MRNRVIILICAILSFSGLAHGQNTSSAPPLPSLSSVTFSYMGKDPAKEPESTYSWRKPAEINFILVTACGRGGGGGPGVPAPTGYVTQRAGRGGNSSTVTTVMV